MIRLLDKDGISRMWEIQILYITTQVQILIILDKLINDPFNNDSIYGGTTTEWNTSMPTEVYTPNTSQGILSSDNIMNIFNRGKTTFR